MSMQDMPDNAAPSVSVIIPMRNEQFRIAQCLDSVLQTDYPKDKLDILVVDGISIDRSSQIVQGYCNGDFSIRLLTNAKKIQAAALNLGINQARGDIIIRMDAHTTYAPDYIRQCVTAVQTSGAVNAGGPQKAVGTEYLSNAIAAALSSPFAAGDAKYRYSKKHQWVDTVYLGAWHKQTLINVGGFNEDWAVNEDYELNYRLRQKGGKILLTPKIISQYYVRNSLAALARRYLRYGFWKVKTLTAHPRSLRWRQLACPVFVASSIGSVALIPGPNGYAAIIPIAYIVANLIASFLTAVGRGFRYLPLLPLIFAVVHICWGIGFWTGLVKFTLPKLFSTAHPKASPGTIEHRNI